MNLIDRQAAIKAIDDLPNCYNGYSDTYDKAYIIGVLEEVPTADVEPVKHGKWITRETAHEWIEDFCSVCGHRKDFITTFEYCPHCGAKMEQRR